METKIIQQPTINERSPSPGILALLYFTLFAGGMIYSIVSTSGASYPQPYQAVEKAQEYYSSYAGIIRVNSLFLFWSALPLGIYTAIITSRLKLMGIHRSGLSIASFGGFCAAIFLALSGICTWILSQPFITTDASVTRALQLLSFATGGTGNVVMSGLLIAGISVTAGLAKIISKWIMWSGLFLAIVSVLAMFNMVFPAVSILLPIGRFLGMIWLIIAGFAIAAKKKG